MPRGGYRWAFAPLVVLGAISLAKPLREQPRLTMAWTLHRFMSVVEVSGGAGAVHEGMYLDFVFIAVFAATVPAVLWRNGRFWPVAAAAVILDATEDGVALSLLHGNPTTTSVHVMGVVAGAKLTCYLGSVVSVVRGVWSSHGTR